MRRFASTLAVTAALSTGALAVTGVAPAFAQEDPGPATSGTVTSSTGTSGTGTSTTGADPAGTGRPTLVDALGRILGSLVDEGVLTREQADAVLGRVAEVRQQAIDAGLPGRHPVARRTVELAAETIGVGPVALVREVRGGATVADVATAHDVDPEAVVQTLVDAGDARIDQGVASGRLGEEQAADRRAELRDRAQHFVYEAGPSGSAG